MKRSLEIAACLLLLPGATFAATKTYDVGAFEGISVAAGVTADITVGGARSVVAETASDDFDDLRISVQGNVLRIERTSRGWLSFGRRPQYRVQVATPVLRSLTTSSGAEATVKGTVEGDFSVEASSGSEIDVPMIKGGNVKAQTSSGSDINLAGTCRSLNAEASSGSDLDAEELKCEEVTVQSSSGSDISVFASKRVAGKASSGSDIEVSGAPAVVEVDKSSGADVEVRK